MVTQRAVSLCGYLHSSKVADLFPGGTMVESQAQSASLLVPLSLCELRASSKPLLSLMKA